VLPNSPPLVVRVLGCIIAERHLPLIADTATDCAFIAEVLLCASVPSCGSMLASSVLLAIAPTTDGDNVTDAQAPLQRRHLFGESLQLLREKGGPKIGHI